MRVNKLSGIVTRLAAILLCLVLFSAHIASGMFARYTAGATVASQVRVAKAGITAVAGDENEVAVDKDGNASYTFNIVNTSETALSYDLIIRYKAGSSLYTVYGADVLKRVISDVHVDDIYGSASDDGKTYTLSGMGYLEPGQSSGDINLLYKIHVIAKNTEGLDAQRIPAAYPLDFDVYVRASQVN